MSEREQQTARESLWFGWGLEAWKNFQELAWNKAFCGPIKHLALRAVSKHKNYFLPRAQLLRKHLFWDELFYLQKASTFQPRESSWRGLECAQVSVGSEQSRATEPQPNNYRRRVSGIFAMSQLINLPLHIYSRAIRVEDKSGSLFFGCISSYQRKFLANCAK